MQKINGISDAGSVPDRFRHTGQMGNLAPVAALNPTAAPAGRWYQRSGPSLYHDSMQQLLVVTGLAVLYLFGLLVFRSQDLLAPSALALAAAASAMALGGLFILHRSGLNRCASDRNLTTPKILCGLAILLGVAYAAPATHIMFGPYLLLTLAFGTDRLDVRTIFLLTLAGLAGFGVVIVAHHLQRQDPALLQSELLHLLVLLLVLPGFALLAARVRRMNHALFRAGVKIVTIKETARRDPMLGCYNRRYTTAALEQHKRVADATGAGLCLALIDLDHFKRVNDEIGHLGGDAVLRTFARTAQANVRRNDIFGRYGGEEFLLILPDTELLTALNIAERIRAQIERIAWDSRLSRGPTVSIGLTRYIPGESALDLFSRADSAVYAAKRGGRNQVVVEEPVVM